MWYIILGFLALLYILFNLIFPGQAIIWSDLIGPSLWMLLGLLTVILARIDNLSIVRFTRTRRWYLGNSPIQAGFLLGAFQVALYILIGLFAGFGKSPYSFTFQSILLNLFFVSSFLFGIEFSRAYLIKRTSQAKKYTTLILGLTTILFGMIQITPSQITQLFNINTVTTLEFIGTVLITSFALNLLASYLSYLGGASASMAYVGTILAFEWFSPILPNPHWTIMALAGTIAPTIGFFFIQSTIKEPRKKKFRIHRKKSKEIKWTTAAFFSVIILFASFGYLGLKPTVIYSGSMTPTLEVGDMPFIEKVKTSTIKRGDIIQFLEGNITVVHRVVNISIIDGNIQFITKGDANANPDPIAVDETQVLGRTLFTIPKLGWIQILTRELIQQINQRLTTSMEK